MHKLMIKHSTLFAGWLVLALVACKPFPVQSDLIVFLRRSAYENSTWLFNPESGQTRLVTNDPNLTPVGWSPDGSSILLDGFGHNRSGEVWLYKLAEDKLIEELNLNDYPELSKYFGYNENTNRSHHSYWLNEKSIVIQGEKGGVVVIHLADKKVISVLENTSVLSAPSLTADSYRLADILLENFLTGQKTLLRSDGKEYKLQYPMRETSANLSQNAYVSDGKPDEVLDLNAESYSIIISKMNKQGDSDQEAEIVKSPHLMRNLHWAPDNQKLFYEELDANNQSLTCHVFNAVEKKEIYNQKCEDKGEFLWSPRSDGFILQSTPQNYVIYNLDGTNNSILGNLSSTTGEEPIIIDWQFSATK
jgi:hypothetical protein